MRTLHTLDPEAWKVVAMTYCEWAEGSFEFSYCDVVVQRLEEIFHLGDLETKPGELNIKKAFLGAEPYSENNRKKLEELVDPANYLGVAGEMVDRVLAMRK